VLRAGLTVALLIVLAVACNSAPPTATPTAPSSLTPTPSATLVHTGPTAAPDLFDFGDAPDPSYPTLLDSNGARTRVIDQFWLGNLRTPSVTDEPEAKVVNLDELDDGLESYITFNGQTRLAFRAVRGPNAQQHVPYFIVYFNLLVDLNRDGHWQGLDWVMRNHQVDLTDQNEVVIDVTPGLLMEDTWIRAALTDTPVADSAAEWDGTGEFAVGEIEDYYLPSSPPSSPPPTYYPTPTPTYSPTPTPSPTPERTITTGTPGPTVRPSPTFVYTGDFVVECDPDPAAVVHGESVTMALKVVSGQHTPPERFSARVAGGEEFGGGTVGVNPAPGEDGWSAWGDGASVAYTSTHVDPPARVERTVVVLTLQSLSTTRTEYCEVDVTHTAPTAVPTQISTPTIRVEPEMVTLSLVGQVKATVEGTHFTPGGKVDIQIKPPNHPATNVTERAGTDGKVSLDLQLQPGMPKGTWQVTATDRATGVRAEATFQVR
jgi:hypothetical protein